MPKVRSTLGAAEQSGFARWLDEARERSGRSNREITSALFPNTEGGRSGFIGGYFTGASKPTGATLEKLASVLGVSRIEAFLRGGYASELFTDLARLEKLGRAWCEQDGAELQPDRLGYEANVYRGAAKPTIRTLGAVQAVRTIVRRDTPDGKVYEIIRDSHFNFRSELKKLFSYFADQGGEEYVRRRYVEICAHDKNKFVISRSFAAAINLGLMMLPARLFRRSPNVFENLQLELETVDSLIEESHHVLQSRNERARLPLMLDRAAKVLGDVQLSHPTREAVAAEYVSAWADNLASDYAQYARRTLWCALPE